MDYACNIAVLRCSCCFKNFPGVEGGGKRRVEVSRVAASLSLSGDLAKLCGCSILDRKLSGTERYNTKPTTRGECVT